MTTQTDRKHEDPTVLVDDDLLPDDDDVRFYEQHGWFVTKPVLPPGFHDDMQAIVERFYDGERDARLPVPTGHVDWRPGDPSATRLNEHASYQHRALRRLLLQPIIGAIAARLARTCEIRLMEDTLIYKEPTPTPRTGGTGWHTDDAYSSTCTSRDTLTAWVPLHAVDELRAPLVVLDGSHRWPDTDHMRQFNSQDLEGVVVGLAEQGRDVREVPILLEAGQISFHHCRTVHGSYPNRSDQPRIAFAVQLQSKDNRYREFWNTGRQIHHYLDGVCRRNDRGEPDYSDPAVFPVLWRTPSSAAPAC